MKHYFEGLKGLFTGVKNIRLNMLQLLLIQRSTLIVLEGKT